MSIGPLEHFTRLSLVAPVLFLLDSADFEYVKSFPDQRGEDEEASWKWTKDINKLFVRLEMLMADRQQRCLVLVKTGAVQTRITRTWVPRQDLN